MEKYMRSPFSTLHKTSSLSQTITFFRPCFKPCPYPKFLKNISFSPLTFKQITGKTSFLPILHPKLKLPKKIKAQPGNSETPPEENVTSELKFFRSIYLLWRLWELHGYGNLLILLGFVGVSFSKFLVTYSTIAFDKFETEVVSGRSSPSGFLPMEHIGYFLLKLSPVLIIAILRVIARCGEKYVFEISKEIMIYKLRRLLCHSLVQQERSFRVKKYPEVKDKIEEVAKLSGTNLAWVYYVCQWIISLYLLRKYSIKEGMSALTVSLIVLGGLWKYARYILKCDEEVEELKAQVFKIEKSFMQPLESDAEAEEIERYDDMLYKLATTRVERKVKDACAYIVAYYSLYGVLKVVALLISGDIVILNGYRTYLANVEMILEYTWNVGTKFPIGMKALEAADDLFRLIDEGPELTEEISK